MEEDIFIPPNALSGAMQGDEVLVELEAPRPDGRRAGRVARVLERRNPTVVGIFHYGASGESFLGEGVASGALQGERRLAV